tara:strand:- start:66 stop:896 length:831 start_codon:yes stop_codon:yes gene_type:complete
MASTYSDLKIELIGTGDQTGTWGSTTNNNFSVAFQEAITGSADVAFSSADVTVTLTDTNASQTARNLRLNLTGTSGGARQLILGSGCQVEKLYLINNGLADAVTVKNTSGTGIAVPAGKSMFVYNNGTNVVEAVNSAVSLAVTGNATVGGTLGVTGNTTLSGTLGVTGVSTFSADSTYNGTGQIKVPAGTTAQRSGTPVDGMFRYNSDIDSFEGYVDGVWGGVGGAQAGGVIYENALTVTANYTLTTNKNGFSVGPITISGGAAVTIPSGQRWVIL